MKRKGFTLVELVVVVAIIAILAAVALPRFSAATESSKVASFQSNHRAIVAAITLYQAQHNGATPDAPGTAHSATGVSLNSLLDTPMGAAPGMNGMPEGSTYAWTPGNPVGTGGSLESTLTGLKTDPQVKNAKSYNNGTLVLEFLP